MDSEKDMEEYQGQQVFVSQLLDWDSLTHKLIIPAEKVEAFKGHCNYGIWTKGLYSYKTYEEVENPHAIVILFEKGGYKAFAWNGKSSLDNQTDSINIRYTNKLAQALKEKFKDSYQWLLSHRNDTESICPIKIRISLVASYSVDVYRLIYTIENDNSVDNSTAMQNTLVCEAFSKVKDTDASLLQNVPSVSQSNKNNIDNDDSADDRKHFSEDLSRLVNKSSMLIDTQSEVNLSTMTNQGDLIQQNNFKQYDIDSSHEVIFCKRLNWGMMNLGLQIPGKMIDTFFRHLSYKPLKGHMYPVTLIWAGKEYSVKIKDVNYGILELWKYCREADVASSSVLEDASNVGASDFRVVQIRYTPTSAIAKALQTKFQSTYHQLQNDHKNTEGINTFISLITTDRLDCFALEVSDEEGNVIQDVSQSHLKNENANESSSTSDITVKTVCTFRLSEDMPQLTFTRPIDFILNRQTYYVRSWADLLIQFAALVVKNQDNLSPQDIKADGLDLTQLTFISSSPLNMRIPRQIGNNLWIETNINALQLIGYVKRIVLHCHLDLHDIIIHYERKHDLPSQEVSLESSVSSQNNFSVKDTLHGQNIDDSCQVIFSKCLNWSMMTLGMTIPVNRIKAFFDNLSYHPVRGRMYPVTLILNGIEYIVKMEDVNYSSKNRYQTVQIRYNPTSPFAIALKYRFQSAYRQLEKDHKNTDGIDTIITLVTTNRLNCFKLEISQNQVSVSKSVAQLTSKQEDTNEYSAPIDTLITEQEQISPEFTEECRQVLETAFTRGFKNGSVIDRNKFVRKYEEIVGKPLADEDTGHVWEACSSIGIVVDDKVFPLTDSTKETVKQHAEELIQKGARQIYFTSLFDQFQDVFCENGIGSSDILAAVMSKVYPDYTHTDQFIQIGSTVSSEDEIVRILRDFGPLTLDDLQEKLPGMPKENILQACKTCKDVMKDGDRYILLEDIQFDEAEISQVRKNMEASIENHGYMMLREINLENSLVLNDDISFESLAKVAFSRYFADDFSLANSLISRKGESLSVSKILKAFCGEHKQFSLKEIEDFANEINGYDSAQSLWVAQSNAIQVDDEHFVHPSLIDFDVEATDRAIENAMIDKMQPLQAFYTFFNFPAVPGYPWTLKLLASYCRLISQKFSLLEHAPNNVSIGIIIQKNIRCSGYYHAVAMMAMKDNIPMDYDSIGNFAIRKGLLNRKRPSALSSILTEMKQLSGEA